MFVPRKNQWNTNDGFLTEMHTHVRGGSGCAMVDALDTLKAYKEYGYTTVVITNHYGPWGEATTGLKYAEYIDRLKELWQYAKDEGEKVGIYVLYGIELSFEAHDGDYLVYGFDWEFLYQNLNIYKELTIKEFYKIANENGFLVYQAHPFRDRGVPYCTDNCLDGLEVYNGHPGNDSRNELAYNLAREKNMLMVSGSDFHGWGGECRGGIITKQPIVTIDDLMSTLRAQDYDILVDADLVNKINGQIE
ncbi:MAG TPA: transposase [Clostridia bacterium]|nr:transposase [Clostridia bacterium]